MLILRKANDRGHFKNEWLDSYHSFSFGEYYDPKHMQYGDLRVINHDVIAGGSGFPTHGHKDMEIITYVVSGVLEHKDSMGNKEQIRPGEIQMMTAGTGVSHSEYNPDPKTPAEIIQIWILPAQRGLVPSYKQKLFSKKDKHNDLQLIVSPDGVKDSLKINQEAHLYAGIFDKDFHQLYKLKEGRGIWIQVVWGSLIVNKEVVDTGDGVAIENESEIHIDGGPQGAEFLLFEVRPSF